MANPQEVVSMQPDELAKAYFGGLVHNHTVLSNYAGHSESDLSVDRFVQSLVEAGLAGVPDAPLEFLMFNEHPSNPTRPHRLGALSLRGQRLLRQRRRPTVQRVPLLYGLEVSLLPGGRTDLTPRLADHHCQLVIASRHALPKGQERNPDDIMALFEAACANRAVEVLGHPARYIEDLVSLNWAAVFDQAARSGTAIEINYNTFPGEDASNLQQKFWSDWLAALAKSSAQIIIGADIHNQYQLDQFILQWESLQRPTGRHENHLARFVVALERAHIPPERVVSARHDTFLSWLHMDKPERSRLHLIK